MRLSNFFEEACRIIVMIAIATEVYLLCTFSILGTFLKALHKFS